MEIIGYPGNCQSPGKSGQISIEGNPVWWMNVVIYYLFSGNILPLTVGSIFVPGGLSA